MNTEKIKNDILNKGFHIIEKYLEEEKCDKIVLEINKTKKKFNKSKTNLHINGSGKDLRYTNYEVRNITAKNFLNDMIIHKIFEELLERKIVKKRCQAGIVEYNEKEKQSSGGGWHIDNKQMQFKAMIYLTDVDIENGPFSLISNTKNLILPNTKGDKSGTRFDEETIFSSPEINKNDINIITGKKGTCILFNARNIHRGMEIKKEKRYTLTNYYY
jgi:hypothetical protein